GDDVTLNAIANEKIEHLKLSRRLAKINGEATPQAAARLMALLSSPGVAGSDILTASVIADVEKVIAAELPKLPSDVDLTPRPAPAPAPAPAPTAPGTAIRPALSAATLSSTVLSARIRPTATIRPELLTRQPASADLTALRVGLTRVAAAEEAGLTTHARTDTELKLGEAEVMDVAQDYTDPKLGQGLARLSQALGDNWPSVKDAVWLGESGRALALDLSFRKLPEERLEDFATLVKTAAGKQEADEIDGLLAKVD